MAEDSGRNVRRTFAQGGEWMPRSIPGYTPLTGEENVGIYQDAMGNRFVDANLYGMTDAQAQGGVTPDQNGLIPYSIWHSNVVPFLPKEDSPLKWLGSAATALGIPAAFGFAAGGGLAGLGIPGATSATGTTAGMTANEALAAGLYGNAPPVGTGWFAPLSDRKSVV